MCNRSLVSDSYSYSYSYSHSDSYSYSYSYSYSDSYSYPYSYSHSHSCERLQICFIFSTLSRPNVAFLLPRTNIGKRRCPRLIVAEGVSADNKFFSVSVPPCLCV